MQKAAHARICMFLICTHCMFSSWSMCKSIASLLLLLFCNLFGVAVRCSIKMMRRATWRIFSWKVQMHLVGSSFHFVFIRDEEMLRSTLPFTRRHPLSSNKMRSQVSSASIFCFQLTKQMDMQRSTSFNFCSATSDPTYCLVWLHYIYSLWWSFKSAFNGKYN